MPMNGIILLYPLDPTGISPNNLVVGEPHTLGPGQNRAFVSNYGPFFTGSMVVTETNTGRVLTKGTHYVAAQLYQEATMKMNKEVCGVVVITDPTVSNELLFTYQVVGGVFSSSAKALEQMINNLDLDDRVVEWGDIVGTPSEYPPAPHLHDLGDLYGFEYVVEALEALRVSILIGDGAAHEELRQWVALELATYTEAIALIRQSLLAHESNFLNPHQVTKTQVGLSAVQNFGVATNAEAIAGEVNNAYMTPLRTKEAITAIVTPLLNAHINNTLNPHGVTKTQVGLGNVLDYGVASLAQAQAGTANTVYMTPLRVADAIETFRVATLLPHINNVNNPHVVTKAQVGLSLVENLALASLAEAQAGVIDTKYMTPLRTSDAIVQKALIPLNAHIANVANPHNVTKAQVGLTSVLDYGVATKIEAEAGIVSNKYMTPQRTKEAIDALIGNALALHLADNNNPHGVTKTQVGLSLVENLSLASTAEATDGTTNGRYMTPLRTKEAITLQAVTPMNAHITNGANPHSVTAVQVGAYTTGQTDGLLNTKLGVTATAANSNLLSGATHAQVLASAYAQVGSMGKRNLFTSTIDPSAGSGVVGDVWFKY